MKDNLVRAVEHMMKSEGGFVNHPLDPGGMTNLGVTQRVWEEWIGHPVDEKAMRALTPAIVAPMYKKKYWDTVAGDSLPSGVDLAVFDFSVNSGPGRAAKMLQRVLGVKQDGDIGEKTLAKATSVDSSKLIADYNIVRLDFLQALPAWDTFGKGWSNRVAAVTADAITMTA
jgi:lysozyme family protein